MNYIYNIVNPSILKKIITLSCHITDYCYLYLDENTIKMVVKDNIDKYQMIYTLYTKNNSNHNDRINIIYKINLFSLKKIFNKIKVNELDNFNLTFTNDKLLISVINQLQNSLYCIFVEKSIEIDGILSLTNNQENDYVNIDIFNLYQILYHIKDLDEMPLKITLYQNILQVDFYHLNYKGNITKKLKDNYPFDRLEIDINKDIFLKILKLNTINHIGKLYKLDNYNIIEINNKDCNLRFIYK